MFTDKRLGNTPRYYAKKPKDWDMRIPEILRKNIVFLGRIVSGGGQESVRFGGTGFFVGIPSCVPDLCYDYLVTAKHVAEQLALGQGVMRLNTEDGKFKDIRFEKDHKWYYHPTNEDTTDVAVTEITVPEDIDGSHLEEPLFVDDKVMAVHGIGAGDDVFMVGLFNRMRGRARNMPIVRTGNIAMIPDAGELVPGVKIGKGPAVETDVYLVEARSLGGLSGSPVFVQRATVDLLPKNQFGFAVAPELSRVNGMFFLLGLMNGHWEIDPKEKNEADPRFLPAWEVEAVNTGIAVVVPAKKIRETLYHPELVASRQDGDRAYREAQGTTTPD